jgi:hypothetical protein
MSGWKPSEQRMTAVVPEKMLDLRAVKQLVIAGWTGRDVNALEAHMRELEAIGVRRPKSTPIFYRASASLLTCADSIEVVGEHFERRG